jgi:hypothetical protein
MFAASGYLAPTRPEDMGGVAACVTHLSGRSHMVPAATSSFWQLSHRADPRAKRLADRHYNRQKPDSPQFVPPGSCLVLITPAVDAVWVTSAPIAEYVQHAWAGAWVCSMFRREPECPHLASELIRDAVAVTRWRYGDPPTQGFVTFIDRGKTRSKRDPGYCYLKAGWSRWGRTKGGLYAMGLSAEELIQVVPAEPLNAQIALW